MKYNKLAAENICENKDKANSVKALKGEIFFGPSVLRAPAEQTKVSTVLGILVRAECVRCPWLLA